MGNNFVDYVKFYAKSGNGGEGVVHFRREKFEPKGGPDGGDGGRGGHILLKCNAQLWTLLHLKYKKHIIAPNGIAGSGQNKIGKNGQDIVLEVPKGTLAKDENTGILLAEMLQDGQEEILIPGGKGGLGNTHFKTSTRQTPRYAQPGIPGEEKTIILELKILADVGLVGFPNAGKSTLLSVISDAKPKIANYEFTTLTPNLGVVAYKNHLSFVVADIPGIIKGASKGKGLGFRFLRHIERNHILLFLIPADSKDIVEEYSTLKNELVAFNPEFSDKESALVITKSDLLDEELKTEIIHSLPQNIKPLFISSITHQGITALKDSIWTLLHPQNMT